MHGSLSPDFVWPAVSLQVLRTQCYNNATTIDTVTINNVLKEIRALLFFCAEQRNAFRVPKKQLNDSSFVEGATMSKSPEMHKGFMSA